MWRHCRPLNQSWPRSSLAVPEQRSVASYGRVHTNCGGGKGLRNAESPACLCRTIQWSCRGGQRALQAYAKMIEAEKPDAVLTQWPIDNHPTIARSPCSPTTHGGNRKRASRCITTRYRMGRIRCSSPLRTTSISRKRKRLNMPPAMRMRARRPTGITHYRTRLPLFGVLKAATRERRHLFSRCRARVILCGRHAFLKVEDKVHLW